jgi:methylthioribulose-1-phosphate dehydratase
MVDNVDEVKANFNRQILELKKIVSAIANQGWCPATGGNFSVKLDANLYAITASGVDKVNIKKKDFLVIDSNGKVLLGDKKPSAETLLHTALYKLDRNIGAILHVHTLANTVLSLHLNQEKYLAFQGYEMQKALTGITTHETMVKLNILDNNQDMQQLAKELKQRWLAETFIGGLLVRGHGLYAWGDNLAEAKRHLEGIEFLLSCELQKKLISGGRSRE